MLFAHLSDLAGSEVTGCSHQMRPQPAMNQRYLAANKPADQHLSGIDNRIQHGEYSMTL
jgi:hypothetical protein